MAERINIAKMAEVVSEDIFSNLGWHLSGPPNYSWKCTNPNHDKKDHPTDVTFVYTDPYTNKKIHLLTDLKSYAANSISINQIIEMIESLALAVDCAKTNRNYKDIYLENQDDYEIYGFLFIYNHDGKYDKNFQRILSQAFESEIKIPSGVRIYVTGPDDIWYINEIIHDLAILRQKKIIPYDNSSFNFYYHSHSRKKFVSSESTSTATIDLLKGKYQILTYNKKSDGNYPDIRGVLIYYRGEGRNEQEFLIVIDMLRSYGILDVYDEIHIRCARNCDQASVFLDKAKKSYSEYPADNMPKKLDKIKFASVSSVRPRLTEYEVVMGD